MTPFQLKGTVSRTTRVDPDDTRGAKEALLRLGYFKTPSWGLTQYPDEPLFAAIEDFQRDHDLYRDGIMRPDGETAMRLGQVLATLEQPERTPAEAIVEGEHDWEPWRRHGRAAQILMGPSVFGLRRTIGDGRDNDPADLLAIERALGWAGYSAREGATSTLFDAIKRFQEDHGLQVDGWMRPGGETARALDEAIAPQVQAWRAQHPEDTEQGESSPNAGDEQVAWLAQAVRLGRAVAPLISGAIAGRPAEQPRHKDTAPAPSQGARRTDVADPPPPTPPSEPSGEEPDGKEEFPAEAPEIPIFRGRPINEVLRDEPLIFEIVSEDLRREVEAALEAGMRGDDSTEDGNRRVVRMLEEEMKAWASDATLKHTAGAFDSDGEPLKELYIESADGTKQKGSSYVDIGAEVQTPAAEAARKLLINTGRMLKDGTTLTADERRKLANVVRNATHKYGDPIVAGLPKLRPHMNVTEWESEVRPQVREILKGIFGDPRKN
jgi:peptidoglycan hydrolase-like protein with peptidoglycan-binding domain